LVETLGPPGYEKAVRDLVQAEIKPFVEEMHVDALGNLISRKGQKGDDGLRIMLVAHLDEIGLIVTHIDEKGFIRFSPLGHYRPGVCLGNQVQFINGMRGIIGSERMKRLDQAPSFEQLFIDVGIKPTGDYPVKVGDVAGFERPMIVLGNRLVAKSMDDRTGIAVLIETLRKLRKTPHELYFVFSAQEEVGERAAGAAAYAIEPDLAIAVDITSTGDTPGGRKMDVGLGKGPAIKIRDVGMLSDPRIVRIMADTADKTGTPYQLEILETGTTDLRSIQMTGAGVPSGCLSIPCRYVHSPSEMVDFEDVEQTTHLLTELLANPLKL
jgi:putative aminopeptidase FrvX